MKSSKNACLEGFIFGGRGLHFGAFLGGSGASGSLPGASWGPPGGVLGILGPPRVSQAPPGGLLGASRGTPGSLPGVSGALKTAQDGAKMAPRWPKMAPRRPPGGVLGLPGRQKEEFHLACRVLSHFERILHPKNIKKSLTCHRELLKCGKTRVFFGFQHF